VRDILFGTTQSLSSMSGDSSREVRLQFSRIEFDTALLVTSEKRKVHGPTLYLFGTPNVFEPTNGPSYTIDLPCGARHAVLDNPPVVELKLQPWFPKNQSVLPHVAGLVFELTARHCKSDRQQEVCHTYGYGVLPLSQLFAAKRSSSDSRSSMIVPFVLVDRPLEFEVDFAKRAIEAGAQSEEFDKLSRLRQAFLRASGGAECFERMRVIFHNPRIEMPSGISEMPSLPPTANALVSMKHDFQASDFDFIGSSMKAQQAMKRLKQVFEQQRDRTYEPYGGTGAFEGYRAMDSMWKNYFVPAYKRGCGVDEPSALALMCTWFDRRVPERLFSHLLRAQLTVHGMSVERFLYSMRGVLTAHATWVAEAIDNHVSGTKRHTHVAADWKDDPAFIDKHQLSVDEQRCLGFVVAALTSLANACCYTTDFAEIAKINDMQKDRTNPAQPVVQGVEEIVTEQFETAPLRVRAIDCEDGAAWFMRLWFSLVTNVGSWSDPVVALAAQVMDLYVVCINKMHCGECHIMPTLYLRDYALGMLKAGYKTTTGRKHSTAEAKRWLRGIHQTCLWPAYMYQGSHPGSLGHRMDVDRMLVSNKPIHWPIPHVLYAEPTRTSPSNQMPLDTYVNSDKDQVARRQGKHYMRMRAVDQLNRTDMETFGGLEPYVTFPQMISTERALQNPLELSRFYRGFIVGCMIPPVYRLLQQDMQDSLGTLDGVLRTSRTEQALQEAHYFADVSYHHRAHPNTFGVYHVQVAGNDPQVSLIPYASLDLELLLWVAHVHGVEPPVLPGRLPEHLQKVPLEALGQFETVPHIENYPPLRGLLNDGERFRHLLYGAKLGEQSSEQDQMLQECIDVRFLPHNGSMKGDLLHRAVTRAPQEFCRAIFVRRIPLAIAPEPAVHGTISEDDSSALQAMVEELHLAHLDATQLVPLVDNKSRLMELARHYDLVDRYSVKQWDALRHHLGALVRHAPLYLNYVCLACSTESSS
jgi:hypothetical protein